MITFLWIYIIAGVIVTWFTMEMGHAEAKEMNMTLYEYHKKWVMDKDPEAPSLIATLVGVWVLWWFVLAVMIATVLIRNK